MTREILAQVLESEEIRPDDRGYSIPDDRETVCLISSPGEIFMVERVVRMDLREKYLYLENVRREHFFFDYEAVLAVRMLAAPIARRDRGPGFAR
jgi:hypothetical protein